MPYEDRVITTDQLIASTEGPDAWAQLEASVLRRLDPLGFHVLVRAPTLQRSPEDRVPCSIQLQLVDGASDRLQLSVPRRVLRSLPLAFDVLARIPALAGVMVRNIEEWLRTQNEGDTDNGR